MAALRKLARVIFGVIFLAGLAAITGFATRAAGLLGPSLEAQRGVGYITFAVVTVLSIWAWDFTLNNVEVMRSQHDPVVPWGTCGRCGVEVGGVEGDDYCTVCGSGTVIWHDPASAHRPERVSRQSSPTQGLSDPNRRGVRAPTDAANLRIGEGGELLCCPNP